MSYNSIARASASQSLRLRVAACAAQEGETQPERWAFTNSFLWAAQPGWGEAFASALANGITDPGADEAVITDGQILAAVQVLLGVV